MVIDAKTGQKANYGSSDTIIEAYKNNTLVENFFEDGEKIYYNKQKKNIFNFY